ncbi:MAG: hypothetical protein H0X30_07430 [Anaerolineae bacterium]|nr:hypothetical protein [Anaerolineae bacterium]
MSDMSFEQVITLSDTLSLLEKVRLVEHVMNSLKNDIEPKQPRKLLRGLWSDTNITAEEIDEARKEMWSSTQD